MKNNYKIEKVDPSIYTDEDWQRYFDFRVKSQALKNEPMPFNSLAELKELNTKNIGRGEELYIVWKNEQENGILFFDIEFKEQPEKRFTYLHNYMNDKHLEPNLLELMFRQFIDYDGASSALAIESEGGMNDYVTGLYKAEIGATLEQYELNVKEANTEKINSWLAEASSKFLDFKIVFMMKFQMNY